MVLCGDHLTWVCFRILDWLGEFICGVFGIFFLVSPFLHKQTKLSCVLLCQQIWYTPYRINTDIIIHLDGWSLRLFIWMYFSGLPEAWNIVPIDMIHIYFTHNVGDTMACGKFQRVIRDLVSLHKFHFRQKFVQNLLTTFAICVFEAKYIFSEIDKMYA